MSRTTGLFAALVFVPALAFAQQPCTTDARQVVNELYRHILERSADGGSQHWVDQLASRRMSVREVAHHITASEEHTRRFAPGTNHREAVATLYRHLLGRQPDEAGLNHWSQMAASRGIGPVIESLVNSEEYMNSFGDWGVPGSGGLRFCAPDGATSAPLSSTTSNMRFRGMDADGDGRITRSEWRGNVRAFRDNDWNNDGVLSGDEVRPGGRARARAADSFADLDEDRNGRISLDEWQWSRRSFDLQDENGDGVITRREFHESAVPTTGR